VRRSRVAAAGVALAATGALFPTAAGASVRITTDPTLSPPYKPYISDYVSRCVPGSDVRVSVSASDGDRVAVGSRPERSGDFTDGVKRKSGTSFTVKVASHGQTTTHHVRCLPRDFPDWTTRRTGTPQAQWYVLTPTGPHSFGYVAIFDTHGVPVWWMHASSYAPWDGKLLPDGNLAWARSLDTHFGVDPSIGWEEHRLDGRLVRTLKTTGSPTDTHDLEQLPNGHYLLDTYKPRSGVDLSPYGGPKHARVYDGEIQELTRAGKVVWSWNSKDHIGLSETGRWYPRILASENGEPASKRTYDLVHLNSVEPDGDGYVVSARFLDAVFRIDKATGDVTWKLGGTKTSKSLAVENDPLASLPFDGQHDARLYSDHTLTVFDNGSLSPRRPRVVRYGIDTGKRTATLIEQIRQSETPRSTWGGSARKLPGGNWVIYWGGTRLMTEMTVAGEQVLGILLGGDVHDVYSYRAFPMPPGQLSAKTLRHAMTEIVHADRVEIGR
jgi:hypothetical protein